MATALLGSCGTDQGPVVELPIDGQWDLVGLFAVDVEGVVQCRMSGTLDLEQLPGGVNTVVGSGRHAFDCTVAGEAETWEVESVLTNSRLQAQAVSFTMGVCGGGARYDAGRPDVLLGGITFCRASFTSTGQVALGGTWEGRRVVAP